MYCGLQAAFPGRIMVYIHDGARRVCRCKYFG
ncbi:MAG: hypothetical protein V8R80_07710 [Eubacterium sp.]